MQKVISSIILLIFLGACAEKADQNAPETPFIHSVYFWFNEDVANERIASFRKASQALERIEGVRKVYIGTAAETFRPIVERSYDLALIVHLDDLAAHDAYQNDPIHLALLEKYGGDWQKVMITDVD